MSDENVISIEGKLTPKQQLCDNWYWLGYWSVMGSLDKECCENIFAVEEKWKSYIDTDDSLDVFKYFLRGAEHAKHELQE